MILSTNFNQSYIGPRNDILNLLPDNINRVLDIGCSIGTLGKQIKHFNENIEVVGIEYDKKMAHDADKYLDKVVVGDIETIIYTDLLKPDYFDVIILADILEHLINPWQTLIKITSLLNNKGVVIASIPNVRHYSTIVNLFFRGDWPYKERGIHDRTHLRFFTKKTIKDMFDIANLNIKTIKRNYRIIENNSGFNRISKLLSFYPCKDFITFQFLIVAYKK